MVADLLHDNAVVSLVVYQLVGLAKERVKRLAVSDGGGKKREAKMMFVCVSCVRS